MSAKQATCARCERTMRDHGVKAEDAPGTVARATFDTCASCYQRRGGQEVAPDMDAPCVVVKTMLRPSTYRDLRGHAAVRGVDVGELLSRLADASLHRDPEMVQNGQPRKLTDVQVTEMLALRSTGRWSQSALAKRFGVSQPTISRLCSDAVGKT